LFSCRQVGGEISVMAEALDPDLMQPRTEAERRLVAQLQVGRAQLAPGCDKLHRWCMAVQS
jgi:hypothetical protein